MKLPIEFKECPICHSKETIVQQAYAGKSNSGPPEFAAMEHKLIPMISLAKVIGVTVPVIMASLDICANCGMIYCTRAIETSMPANILQGHGQGKPLKFPFSQS